MINLSGAKKLLFITLTLDPNNFLWPTIIGF